MGLGDAAPTGQLLSIPSGDAGTTVTLKIMAQLARQYKVNPLIRQTAARAVNACPAKDSLCEAATLQNFVRSSIRYTGDVWETETVQPPDYTLQEGYGDCDDQATLLASLLLAIGIPAAYCAVGVKGGSFSHVLTVAIIREHTQVLQVPLETTLTNDPDTGAPIGPGWWPSDVTAVRFFHI